MRTSIFDDFGSSSVINGFDFSGFTFVGPKNPEPIVLIKELLLKHGISSYSGVILNNFLRLFEALEYKRVEPEYGRLSRLFGIKDFGQKVRDVGGSEIIANCHLIAPKLSLLYGYEYYMGFTTYNTPCIREREVVLHSFNILNHNDKDYLIDMKTEFWDYFRKDMFVSDVLTNHGGINIPIIVPKTIANPDNLLIPTNNMWGFILRGVLCSCDLTSRFIEECLNLRENPSLAWNPNPYFEKWPVPPEMIEDGWMEKKSETGFSELEQIFPPKMI